MFSNFSIKKKNFSIHVSSNNRTRDYYLLCENDDTHTHTAACHYYPAINKQRFNKAQLFSRRKSIKFRAYRGGVKQKWNKLLSKSPLIRVTKKKIHDSWNCSRRHNRRRQLHRIIGIERLFHFSRWHRNFLLSIHTNSSNTFSSLLLGKLINELEKSSFTTTYPKIIFWNIFWKNCKARRDGRGKLDVISFRFLQHTCRSKSGIIFIGGCCPRQLKSVGQAIIINVEW